MKERSIKLSNQPGPFTPKTTPKEGARYENGSPASARSNPSHEGGLAVPEFYFDKTKGDYWRKTPGGEFIKCHEKYLKRHCQRGGMNVVFKQGDVGLTNFETAICDVQDNQAVDHAYPLLAIREASSPRKTEGGFWCHAARV